MMYSMTGYGKGEAQKNSLTVSVEIKAVNHRYADISVKLPRNCMVHENEIRKQVAQALKRGKIDIFINYELTASAQTTPVLNLPLAEAYQQLLQKMQQEMGLSGTISVEFLAAQKDVIQVGEAAAEADETALGDCLRQAVAEALENHLVMRRAEGEETRKDMEERLVVADALLAQVEARAPQVPGEWQERLTERLARLQQNVEWDPQRVAQEIAVFCDRCDISEEVTRFKSHLVQFRALFEDSEPVGRRMDFIVQEMNREVNTMGSKSNDAELTRSVVALKAELEKVREQVQNVE